MTRTKRKVRNNILFYTALIIILLIILFPFIMMVSVAFKSTAETIGFPPTIIPKSFTFKHMEDIFNPGIFPFLKYFSYYLSNSCILRNTWRICIS